MDSIKEEKKRCYMERWIKIIRDCNESPLTIKEYCRQNNLSLRMYYYNQRKIRENLLDIKDTVDMQQGELVPVVLPDNQPDCPTSHSLFPEQMVIIRFNDMEISVPKGTDSTTLTTVFKVIQAL